MSKQATINRFFKRKHSSSQNQETVPETVLDEDTSLPTHHVPVSEIQAKKPHIEMNEIDLNTIERDPSLRTQIYDYPIHQRDAIRRAYINLGPFRPSLSIYPKSGPDDHKRSFQKSWYKLHSWLEYSQTLDAAFCFPCFLFNRPLGPGYYGQQSFTIDGFKGWKKVGGKTCSYLLHIGSDCKSFHNVAQKACDDMMNEAQDIRNIFETFTDEERKNNRLILSAIVYAVRWCVFQAIAFRGHNEKTDSINKGNFLELLDIIGIFSPEIKELFRTAPTFAVYTSPLIQKEILNLISTRVRRMICEEIDGGKFCLLVDEARDKSNREQMSIVLRFVNKDGFIMERFFGLVHVRDTLILTLPVSTATTERSFSAMNLVKTRLRNKMEDEFLNDSLVLYFERELAEKISLETIVEDFKLAKDR